MKSGLTYRDAGVDIDAGNRLIERIRPLVAKTRRPEVLEGLGGFGGLFALPGGYHEPVLVSGTDGVGTKLKLAIEYGRHDTVGIDLVAMCANDVVVLGAEPLFFLDYYASGRLDEDVAVAVIAGIAHGCKLAGMSLIGGETAEMPGLYHEDDYDLAGFCVGIVEKAKIIDGRRVGVGDVLLGLPSSGPHSNGYSLIRKVLDTSDLQDSTLSGQALPDLLLTPTRIYVPAILKLLQTIDVHALAHVTGGGLPDNLPRVLEPTQQAHIEPSAWRRPAIFDWVQEQGNIAQAEMWRTFNCGIGMVAIVAAEDAAGALRVLADAGEEAVEIGHIESGSRGVVFG